MKYLHAILIIPSINMERQNVARVPGTYDATPVSSESVPLSFRMHTDKPQVQRKPIQRHPSPQQEITSLTLLDRMSDNQRPIPSGLPLRSSTTLKSVIATITGGYLASLVVKLAVVDSQEVEAAEEEAPLRTQTQSARLWQLGYQAARRCKIGFRKCGQAFKFLALPAVQLLGSSISCYHSSSTL